MKTSRYRAYANTFLILPVFDIGNNHEVCLTFQSISYVLPLVTISIYIVLWPQDKKCQVVRLALSWKSNLPGHKKFHRVGLWSNVKDIVMLTSIIVTFLNEQIKNKLNAHQNVSANKNKSSPIEMFLNS